MKGAIKIRVSEFAGGRRKRKIMRDFVPEENSKKICLECITGKILT